MGGKEMTNEERAERLFPLDECKDQFTNELRNGVILLLRKAFIEGAEWKGKHFKEYLERLEDECDKEYKVANANNEDYEVGKAYGRLCMVIEINNGLFKEE